jgi:hypothetical protein
MLESDLGGRLIQSYVNAAEMSSVFGRDRHGKPLIAAVSLAACSFGLVIRKTPRRPENAQAGAEVRAKIVDLACELENDARQIKDDDVIPATGNLDSAAYLERHSAETGSGG